MSRHPTGAQRLVAFALLLALAGCGGPGSSATSAPVNPGTPPTTQAFYIDSTAGSDANAGTSTAAPWRSFAPLAQASYTLPTTVYLKRGDTWHEGLTVPASDFTLDAYGSGAAPVLDGSEAVSAWTAVGGGIYSHAVTLTAGQGLGNLSENGTLMAFLAWQGDVASTFTGAITGSYSYDYADSTLYILPSSVPASNRYLASVVLLGVYAKGLHHVTVRNVTVRRMSLHGVQFQDCDDCNVASSSFSAIGGAVIGSNPAAPPAYLYAGNGIEYDNDSTGGGVSGVTVSDVFDSCISLQTFESGATLSGVGLSGAQVARCGFAGVELSVLSDGGATGSRMQDVSVDGVTVASPGEGWSGRRYGTEGEGLRVVADAGAGSMSGIAVSAMQVSGAAGDGVKLAGEVGTVSLDRMCLEGDAGYGIEVAEPTAKTLLLKLTASIVSGNGSYGILYDAPDAAGLKLYQDSFYDNAGIDVGILAQAGVADIRNDLFYNDTAVTDFYAANILQGVTLDHDCYEDGTNMIGYAGVAYSTLADFTTATGLEAHGTGSGAVGLAGPAQGDLQLTAASNCRGLGDPTVGVSLDYSGARFADPPSSGAYEFQ